MRSSKKQQVRLGTNSMRPCAIPYHLLHQAPISPSQLRLYSSNSRDNEDDSNKSPKLDGSSSTPENSDPGFGFQSLRGLFSSAPLPRSRYSRPKEELDVRSKEIAQQRYETSTGKQSDGIEDQDSASRLRKHRALDIGNIPESPLPQRKTSNQERPIVDSDRRAFFTSDHASSATLRPGQERANEDLETSLTPRKQRGERGQQSSRSSEGGRTRSATFPLEDRSDSTTIRRVSTQEALYRTVDKGGPRDVRLRNKQSARADTPVRLANPFAVSDGTPEPPTYLSRLDPANWNATKENTATIPLRTSAEEKASTQHQSDSPTPHAPSSTSSPEARLTHLTPSGDAHMVSITSKPPTARTAVAFAYIRFSNADTFPLLTRGANKKGDVLATARIAGIMAAKKTADLIPLCHPLPLSHVEVDVSPMRLNQRNADYKFWLRLLGVGGLSHRHGLVAITATAQCTGPTGVEMEALTAALVSAATVFDMCKAVDKGMVVQQGHVVYKAGGRSGTILQEKWGDVVGRRWFEERGMEVPDGVGTQVDP